MDGASKQSVYKVADNSSAGAIFYNSVLKFVHILNNHLFCLRVGKPHIVKQTHAESLRNRVYSLGSRSCP